MSIIGIAGTAKNTGKTTALNALLGEAHRRGVPVGVTSIGYDGEELDNVTGLPKPRVVLHPGMTVSTSLRTLPPAGWSVLERTGLFSALGEIVIARCEKSGAVVLAGPKTRADLKRVTERLASFGCGVMLVDGALNRIAPMPVADTLILATGAARETDIARLAAETAAVASLFRHPLFSGTYDVPPGLPRMLHSADDTSVMLDRHAGMHVLHLPGLISTQGWGLLADALTRVSHSISTIVLNDPVALLLSGVPSETLRIIERLARHGVNVSLRASMTLGAVTVNPFYPRFTGTSYEADTVDAETLSRTMRDSVKLPVIDIVRDGAAPAWEALFPAG